MNHSLLFTLIFLISSAGLAQQDNHNDRDPHELRFVNSDYGQLDMTYQHEIKNAPAWSQFKATHPEWKAIFDENNQRPSRAFGPAIPVQGDNANDKAWQFVNTQMDMFNIPVAEINIHSAVSNGKSTTVTFKQFYNGLEVLFSGVHLKVNEQFGVTSFKAGVHSNIQIGTIAAMSESAIMLSASSGLENVESSTMENGLSILPVPGNREYVHHLVSTVVVAGVSDTGLPYRYRTLVDANTGEVLYRYNEVHTCGHNHGGKECNGHGEEITPPVVASATITGNVSPDPTEPAVNEPFVGLETSLGGTTFVTDEDGLITTNAIGPVNLQVRMQGEWANVLDNNVTPVNTVSIEEGPNDVLVNDLFTDEALYGYHNTVVIHDYMKTVLPSFTGMDFQLPVNIEITPHECNAFYDGSSINFYTGAGDCVSLVTVSDVVYHEYGHGINNTFYQAGSSSFQNGGMNEGYADVWAFAVREDPILGDGHDPGAPDAYIRRYDENPKVYPADLVGQVHADGEIIAGAWWDTHLLMGSDMDLTMQLFAGAYTGFQANTFNGNEGEAFLDVLIDALEFDDDDGNLLNGTPNGDAIAEAFAIHGITFLATAEIEHEEVETALGDEDVLIEAELDFTLQFADYLDGVNLFYRLNSDPNFTELEMTDLGNNEYEAVIPAQPNGTIIGYYMAVRDVFGNTSSVTPVAAHLPVHPNLPNFIMVGYELEETYDSDEEEDVTFWNEGLPTDDATTGIWEEADPIGTFSEGIPVAPSEQATPGGDFCFVTGNVSDSDAIGQNDVDGGTTTLISEEIDMTQFDDPAFSFMRWYTNSPPSGANPGADWWQVQVSDDGGASWVYVENTLASDASWRHMPFRVSDYVDITEEFMIKFNASDSTTIGENLDGGSLIEAALDDFKIWSVVEPFSLEDIIDVDKMTLFPNPADDFITVEFDSNGIEELDVVVYDINGRVIMTDKLLTGGGHVIWNADLRYLSPGTYTLDLSTEEQGRVSRSFVKK